VKIVPIFIYRNRNYLEKKFCDKVIANMFFGEIRSRYESFRNPERAKLDHQGSTYVYVRMCARVCIYIYIYIYIERERERERERESLILQPCQHLDYKASNGRMIHGFERMWKKMVAR
jgi:hypothetical protein